MVYAAIKLLNGGDLEMAKRHVIGQEEVREITVKMVVDSGAYMMPINETIQEQLGSLFIEKRKSIMADGSVVEHDVVGPIIVKFANRTTVCNAVVLQGDNESLLGAIPMEEMDVIIHPRRQELLVNPEHPYYAQLSLK